MFRIGKRDVTRCSDLRVLGVLLQEGEMRKIDGFKGNHGAGCLTLKLSERAAFYASRLNAGLGSSQPTAKDEIDGAHNAKPSPQIVELQWFFQIEERKGYENRQGNYFLQHLELRN